MFPFYHGHSMKHAHRQLQSQGRDGPQELQAESAPVELEGPISSSSWELPNNTCHPTYRRSGHVHRHSDRRPYQQVADGHVSRHHAVGNPTQTETTPYPTLITNYGGQQYAPLTPTNQSPSTASEISPVQGASQPFMHQQPPIFTSLDEQSPMQLNANYSSVSRSTSTSTSISPISPSCGSQIVHHIHLNTPQRDVLNSFPGRHPSMTAFSSQDSSPSETIPPKGVSSLHLQMISPASTRRGSHTTALNDSLPHIPHDPSHLDPRKAFSSYELQQLSGVGSSFSPLQAPPGTISPVSEGQTPGQPLPSNSAAEEYDPQELPAGWARWTEPPPRMDPLDIEELVHKQNGRDDSPPSYTPPQASMSRWEAPGARVAENQIQRTTDAAPAPAGRRRAKRLSIGCATIFSPLPCGYLFCDKAFNGPYQKGNRKRHHKQKHGSIPALYRCRDPICSAEYKRDDARRKHEWKKHRMSDSRPEKRRKEKRIFMPGMSDRERQTIY